MPAATGFTAREAPATPPSRTPPSVLPAPIVALVIVLLLLAGVAALLLFEEARTLGLSARAAGVL